MTDSSAVEPTPVLTQETSLPPLLSSSLDDVDDDNSSHIFDPAESTPTEATPPLPDAVDIIPNLIEDDDNKKVGSSSSFP